MPLQSSVFFEPFVDLSKYFGSDFFWTQGPGGNSSFKDDLEMRIKASGTWMSDCSKRFGWARVGLAPDGGLEVFSDEMPSMEVGLHAVISSRFVFHLHPIVLTSLLSSDLFDNVLDFMQFTSGVDVFGLDYLEPGNLLCREVMGLPRRKEGLICLRNHGLILYSDDLSRISVLANIVEDVCKYFLGQELPRDCVYKSSVEFQEIIGGGASSLMEPVLGRIACRQYVTPDEAIFLDPCREIVLSEEFRLLPSSALVSLRAMMVTQMLNLSCSYLSARDIENLFNNESEKYRMKLVK